MAQRNKKFKGSAARHKGKLPDKAVSKGSALRPVSKCETKAASKLSVISRQKDNNRDASAARFLPRTLAVVALNQEIDAGAVWKGVADAAGLQATPLPALYAEASVTLYFWPPLRTLLLPVFPHCQASDDLVPFVEGCFQADFFVFLVSPAGPDALGAQMLAIINAMKLTQPQIVLCMNNSDIAEVLIRHVLTFTIDVDSRSGAVTVGDDQSTDPAPRDEVLKKFGDKHLRRLLSCFAADARCFVPFGFGADSERLLRHIGSQLPANTQRPRWLALRPHLSIVGVTPGPVDGGALHLQLSGWVRGDHGFTADQILYVQGIGECVIQEIAGVERVSIGSYLHNPEGFLQNPSNSYTLLQRRSEACGAGEAHSLARRFAGTDAADAAGAVAQPEHAGIVGRVGSGAEQPGPAAPPTVPAEAPADALCNEDESSQDDSASSTTDEEGKRVNIEKDYENKLHQRHENPFLFPDEIDIHPSIPLREVLHGWKGMQSARTSPWPYAGGDAPDGYDALCRIRQPVQVFNYAVRELQQGAQCHPGMLVCLRVAVPLDAYLGPDAHRQAAAAASVLSALHAALAANSPLTAFGLLAYETMDSVLTVKATMRGLPEGVSADAAMPLPHNAPFLCLVGFRRVFTAPLPSAALAPGRAKMLRYHQNGEELLTMVAPLFVSTEMLPPCVLFSDRVAADAAATAQTAPMQLCGVGKAVSYDPDTLLLQRIVLTGTPFHISRRRVTVRHMFFSAEDVAYFQPVELATKGGCTGRITQSVGLKGYFKAFFSAPVGHGDTLMLRLYRRKYPPLLTVRCDLLEQEHYHAARRLFDAEIAETAAQLDELAGAPHSE